MICRKCGNEMKDEYHYLFCTQCGAKLDEAGGTDNSTEHWEAGSGAERILSEQDVSRNEAIPTAASPQTDNPAERWQRVRLLAASGILVCIAVFVYVFREEIPIHIGQLGGTSQEISYGETDLTSDDEDSSEAMIETPTEATTEMPTESPQADSETSTEPAQETSAGADSDTSQSSFFNALMDSMSLNSNGEQVTGYFVTASTLNVRKNPGTDSEVLAKLRQNDFCMGTGNKNEDGSWVEISCEDGSVVGWISQEYTENYSGTIDQVKIWAMEKYINMQ